MSEKLDEEQTYFEFSAALRVFGDDLDLEAVSTSLGLKPTHTHKKGDPGISPTRPYQQDMWMYTVPIERTRPMGDHILGLWDALRPHMKYLRQLKAAYRVDIWCGYRSNSDTAGFEVSHDCLGLFSELEVPFGVSVIIA
jgi:hypothetical protein